MRNIIRGNSPRGVNYDHFQRRQVRLINKPYLAFVY